MSRLLPPALWIICLGAMLALSLARIALHLLPPPWHLSGWGLFLLGLGVTFLAARQFRAARTNINTFRNPDHLVTTGFFAISRNPMYLGFALALIGVAIGLNNAYAFLPALFFIGVSALHYIPYEEQKAAEIFGDAYADYRRRVRRWL